MCKKYRDNDNDRLFVRRAAVLTLVSLTMYGSTHWKTERILSSTRQLSPVMLQSYAMEPLRQRRPTYQQPHIGMVQQVKEAPQPRTPQHLRPN